ncbi:GcrA family cell cycle regulator [Microvirga massiliensis]|uniref:GcrA family cell cycle regulator n=1 Tax=Microvirga massiliensis TaxID=1033741 RepID=UPI00062B811E|nr:GcrA family cell cycle regulator [Microvirga massiliensis]
MNDAGGTWTEERVELLKKLWAEGSSASQIAAQIGGVSRNAVIGKIHRLGLSGRGKTKTGAQQQPQRPRKPSGRTPSAPAPLPQPRAVAQIHALPQPLPPPVEEAEQEVAAEEVVVPMSERVTIMELREYMCRWPMGDPTKPEFRFCGNRSLTGLPYCNHHAQIAYQPIADRRRDRRLARA